jgi:S1-C subfamily serine protease
MRNFCVSIGVDGYLDTAWRLGACVGDAIAFADWAVSAGDVAPADLRLFLNPADRSVAGSVTLPKSGVAVSCESATRVNIFRFMQETMQRDHWGDSGDRLYWYFAGHGCSHESVRGSQRPEPVLFPVDVESLPLFSNNLIGFSDIIEGLRWCKPSTQLFFLDACRDFALPNYASSAGIPSGRFLRKLPDDENRVPAKQYVLYATAPGERAAELGRGVFGDILIRGLSGDAGALLRIAGIGDYELTFNRLVNFVRKEVQARVKKALIARPGRVIQIPEVDPDPVEQDFVVATIPNQDVPPLDLYVRVRPQSAHFTGCIQVYYEKTPLSPPCGPPLQAMNKLSLQPSYYRIEASAAGMGAAQATIAVPFDDVVELELTQAASPPQASNQLRFFTKDRNLPVQVWDVDGQPHTALHEVMIPNPKHGLYRAMVLNPENITPPKGYCYPECQAEIELDAQPLAATSVQIAALERAGIHRTGGTITPSERLGELSELKVVSLLGFAAYATYVLRDSGSKLKSFGMLPLDSSAHGQSWVTVIVGATGYEPAPNLSVKTFLEHVTVAVEGKKEEFRILPGFETAGQVLVPCPRGAFSIELRLPRVPVIRYAMIGIQGRIAVLAVTIDDDQQADVQQYLFSFDQSELQPEDLPKLERAQRFYAAGRPVPAQIIDGLLNAKQIDPLQACLAGYSLVRQRQHRRFVGTFQPGSAAWNPTSALQNMLNFFDALPDTHVLAGLCGAENQEDRERHYRTALERGIPLFSDGFRTLIEFFGARSNELFSVSARRAMRTLASGTLFSAWLSREPVIGIQDGAFDPPPANWKGLEERRDVVQRRIAACGNIAAQVGDGERQPLGSGFLIAPDIVLTANHIVQHWLEQESPPLIRPGATIRFVTAVEPMAAAGIAVAEILGIDANARLALLRLKEPVPDVEPVPICADNDKVTPQRNIYLIGYPFFSTIADVELIQHVFDNKFGVKRLQPGLVLAVPGSERWFDHDASTLPGNGGSPVIDLESGCAIGVHWGGMEESGYKRAHATDLTNEANRAWLFAHLP